MNDRTTQEDDLFEFAANPADPTTGLEHTVSQVHRALTAGSHAMPSSIRDQIREELMPSNTASTSGFASPPHATAPTPSTTPIHRGAPPRARFMDTIARWQPVVSMTIVVALLASVIALTYHRGMLDDPSSHLPGAMPATPATADTSDCEPNPPGLSEDQLREKSIDDWRPRSHRFPWPAEPDIELAVQDTLFRYNHCFGLILTGDLSRDAPVLEPFYSDRVRFIGLYDQLAPQQQAGIDAMDCDHRATQVIENFPILVNGERYIFSTTGEYPPRDYEEEWVDDVPVYQIGDGRFAMVFGYVTADTFRNPEAVTDHESLTFLAFTESNGYYYIDEWFDVITPARLLNETPDTAYSHFSGCRL